MICKISQLLQGILRPKTLGIITLMILWWCGWVLVLGVYIWYDSLFILWPIKLTSSVLKKSNSKREMGCVMRSFVLLKLNVKYINETRDKLGGLMVRLGIVHTSTQYPLLAFVVKGRIKNCHINLYFFSLFLSKGINLNG